MEKQKHRVTGSIKLIKFCILISLFGITAASCSVTNQLRVRSNLVPTEDTLEELKKQDKAIIFLKGVYQQTLLNSTVENYSATTLTDSVSTELFAQTDLYVTPKVVKAGDYFEIGAYWVDANQYATYYYSSGAFHSKLSHRRYGRLFKFEPGKIYYTDEDYFGRINAKEQKKYNKKLKQLIPQSMSKRFPMITDYSLEKMTPHVFSKDGKMPLSRRLKKAATFIPFLKIPPGEYQNVENQIKEAHRERIEMEKNDDTGYIVMRYGHDYTFGSNPERGQRCGSFWSLNNENYGKINEYAFFQGGCGIRSTLNDGVVIKKLPPGQYILDELIPASPKFDKMHTFPGLVDGKAEFASFNVKPGKFLYLGDLNLYHRQRLDKTLKANLVKKGDGNKPVHLHFVLQDNFEQVRKILTEKGGRKLSGVNLPNNIADVLEKELMTFNSE